MNRKKSNKYTGVYYQELINGDKSYYITNITKKIFGKKQDFIVKVLEKLIVVKKEMKL